MRTCLDNGIGFALVVCVTYGSEQRELEFIYLFFLVDF